MKGAIAKAEELRDSMENAWIPQQFCKLSHPGIHASTTAQEIIADFPNGFDYLITGVGTGGHITGVGLELKKLFPKTQVIAVEPIDSAVLSGGNPGPHALQGLGAGFVPDTLDVNVLDGVITISKDEAYDYTRRMARVEGICCGISTGAALAAVAKKCSELTGRKRILTFNYDTGERYLSVEGLF